MRQIFSSDTSMSELETPKFQLDLVRQELQLIMDPLLLIKMILYQHKSIVEMTMGKWSSIGLLIVYDTLNLTVKRQLRPWIIGNQLCLFFGLKKPIFEICNNSFFALINLQVISTQSTQGVPTKNREFQITQKSISSVPNQGWLEKLSPCKT
jgi:hypothetical protein